MSNLLRESQALYEIVPKEMWEKPGQRHDALIGEIIHVEGEHVTLHFHKLEEYKLDIEEGYVSLSFSQFPQRVRIDGDD